MALYSGDLKDTISDLVSIDEYKPKTGTDNEIIVVAFYAIDEAPAKDVDSFLERSSLTLVDVEVSPNPNEDGFYVIFIEMYRDDKFPDNLLLLIQEMDRITGGMEWQISPYLADNVYDISDDTWKEFVIYDKNAYMSKSDYKHSKSAEIAKESVMDFFKHTNLRNLKINENMFSFFGTQGVLLVEMQNICTEKELMEKYNFTDKPILWEKTDTATLALRLMLGEGWNVVNHDDSILIMNTWDDRIFYGKLCS